MIRKKSAITRLNSWDQIYNSFRTYILYEIVHFFESLNINSP